MNKRTLVFAASTKPERYSYLAAERLQQHNFEVIPLGFRAGTTAGLEIETEFKQFDDVHTITLYINPQRQQEHYDYLLGLQPKRIIFNPGTENEAFKQLAEAQGIETLYACTLVLLSVGSF